MTELLDHPAVQGGVGPLVVALIVALALARTRFAWIAIAAGYAAMVALSIGFSFSPLTVARKTVLLGLLVPLFGIAADLMPSPSRIVAPALAAVAGVLSAWVFQTILQHREAVAAVIGGAAIALFVAVLTWAVLRGRDDGLRTGAAGLGLGLATGIAGVLSASIGYLVAGVAIAAASGALLLVQVVFSRPLAAGFTGSLPIGMLTALFAAGELLLAELPWYALPLLLLVPAAVALPIPQRAPFIVRTSILVCYAVAAAIVTIAAAWFAARGALS